MLTVNSNLYDTSSKLLNLAESRANFRSQYSAKDSPENLAGRHCNTHTPAERCKYRSQSVTSVDPRSSYFISHGARIQFSGRIRRAPSVSCVESASGAANYLELASPTQGGRHRSSYHELNSEIPGLNFSLSPNDPKAATIHQNYYPEGGWGWVICGCVVAGQILATGLLDSYGFFIYQTERHFQPDVSVIGAGKILGCLFTSFASQFHQLFLSYGVFVGCGVSMTRDASTFMIGQYFKRKREFVEIVISFGTGLGMTVMPLFLSESIRRAGWRLGLQQITGVVSITVLLGIFYRPASLYHPQRRAILHLKGLQKRSKAKDKQAIVEKAPFFDFGVLKSRTVQILLVGTGLAAFGIHTPLILLVYQGEKEGLDYQSLLLLQVFLGLAFIFGSGAFGFIIVKNSVQCMIARQYLCQASSFMISASLLAFTALEEYQGYVLFVWIYGLFYGGYNYTLKMFTFEKVRARNFARAWGFVQWVQAVPFAIGIPVTGYINERYGEKTGYYLSSAFTFIGSLTLFLIDVHKRSVQKRKMSVFSDSRRCSDACVSSRSQRSSFQDSTFGRNPPLSRLQQRSLTFSNYTDLRKQELTCISEEVGMDHFMMDDCITSCNKEEKYLMLSEFEQNLKNTREELDDVKAKASRKTPVFSPPRFETCPSCMKHVPSSEKGSNKQSSLTDFSSVRSTGRQLEETACSVDVIEEGTTSL
ncbi:monocarboxylate transporter 12-like [Tachypleus tridentatus]|uniref:monocarboxylate transporter 12-like n=1 Tax=Tachypleus tridentatus TaxID=6853 RepID=UPI003FD4B1D9